ncbi:MAG: cupin domain-containing protein [Paracoccaceae bacterium]
MLPAGIITVDQNAAGEQDKIAPEKLLSGQNETTVWNAFSDTSGKFHVGHWASGPCKLAVRYSENELCVLLSGRAALTDAHGARAEFGPHEPFVIAAGFSGTWESLGDVTKIYAIYEP